MRIGDRQIGPGCEPYVIAEIGVNHDGEVARALALTEAAAGAGADAVKLQFFETDRLMSGAAKLAAYQKNAGETDPIEMLRRLELRAQELGMIAQRAHDLGIHAIVTVFSTELVGPAETVAWDAYKTASPDIVHRPLLDRLAGTGRPMIVSTGASEHDEVVRAVGRGGWLHTARDRLAVLQCVSCYPTQDEDAALGGIGALARALALPIGYSDHTRSDQTSWMAVASGACVLEKHLTWNRRAPGPDHAASLEPDQFKAYVEAARWVGTDAYAHFAEREGLTEGDPQVGPKIKRVLECERDVRHVSRQSVVSTRAVRAGEVIGAGDVTFKRPGTGLEPWRVGEVVGRVASRDIAADVPIGLNDITR